METGDATNRQTFVGDTNKKINFQRIDRNGNFVEYNYVDPQVVAKLPNYELKNYPGTTQIYNGESCLVHGETTGSRVPSAILFIMHLESMVLSSLSKHTGMQYEYNTNNNIESFQFTSTDEIGRILMQ